MTLSSGPESSPTRGAGRRCGIVRLVIYRERHPYPIADLTAVGKDAEKRSRSTLSGQAQEHLVPLFPEFLGWFNPRTREHFLRESPATGPWSFARFERLYAGWAYLGAEHTTPCAHASPSWRRCTASATVPEIR